MLNTQYSYTRLDVINDVLNILDLSPVITSTDTHASRVILSLIPSVVYTLENELRWVELVTDTQVSELSPYADEVVLSGTLGWVFPYNFKVHSVVDMDSGKALCYVSPKKLEADYRYRRPFIPTADLNYADFVTADSAKYTTDADGSKEFVCSYTVHRNAVFIPNTLDWARFKITHTRPLSIPSEDCDYVEAPDYLVNILELAIAYRYASMYAPARNDAAAARVAGLRNLYLDAIAAAKKGNSSVPLGHRGKIL